MRLNNRNPWKITARAAVATIATAAALAGGSGLATASPDDVAPHVTAEQAPTQVVVGTGPDTEGDVTTDPESENVDLSAIQAVEDGIAARFDAVGITYVRETFDGVNYVQIGEDASELAWQIIADAYDHPGDESTDEGDATNAPE